MRGYSVIYRSNEAINIIKQLLTRESTSIITFDYLMVIADKEESKQLLTEIIQTRRENDERLKWLYFHLAGEMLAVDQDVFERPETYQAGIKKKKERQQRRLRLLLRLSREVSGSWYLLYVENIILQENWIYEVLNYLEEQEN